VPTYYPGYSAGDTLEQPCHHKCEVMANANLLLKKKFAAADASSQANDLWRQNWHLLQFSSAKTVRYKSDTVILGH